MLKLLGNAKTAGVGFDFLLGIGKIPEGEGGQPAWDLLEGKSSIRSTKQQEILHSAHFTRREGLRSKKSIVSERINFLHSTANSHIKGRQERR